MQVIEHSVRRLVVQRGSLFGRCTLTIDKGAGRVRLERANLLWRRTPLDVALSDIANVGVASRTDPASGAEICTPVVHMRSGEIAVLPSEEKDDAAVTAARMRAFLGLH